MSSELGSGERRARPPTIWPASIEDLAAVAGEAREFWGDRELGFTATETADYAGPGETCIVFWKELAATAGCAPAEITAGLSN
jgi:hypothetical protein